MAPVSRIVREIAKRIESQVRPHRIVLFGSRAWGTADVHSDVDLLVIVDSDESPVERAVALGRLFRPRPAPLDLVVLTPREVEERLAAGDTFLKRILDEGVVLYDALAA